MSATGRRYPCHRCAFAEDMLFRGVATAAWIVAWWIKELSPYEREFSIDDTLISHTHRKNQYARPTR